MNEQVYIVGAGGFTSEITEYIYSNNQLFDNKVEILGYFDLDDKEYNRYGYSAPFLGNERDYDFEKGSKVIVTIADAALRMKISNMLEEKGCELYSLTHNNTFVAQSADIEKGHILCPYVTITSNVKIGKSFQANIYSYVAHDCIIGDYVTFAPAVKCNGNIEIEDHAI